MSWVKRVVLLWVFAFVCGLGFESRVVMSGNIVHGGVLFQDVAYAILWR